jgi:hypothetical protein
LLARCSQPLSTNQTPHPTTKRGDNNHTQAQTPGTTPERAITASGSPRSGRRSDAGLLSQSPIVCPVNSRRPAPHIRALPDKTGMFVVHQNHTHYRRGPSNESLSTPITPTLLWAGHESRGAP